MCLLVYIVNLYVYIYIRLSVCFYIVFFYLRPFISGLLKVFFVFYLFKFCFVYLLLLLLLLL